MAILKAILLGIVQGLTEFLPVSSSAHLIIVPWLFRWDDSVLESLSFDVMLHLGTLVSLLAVFASDWVRLIRAGVSSVIERRVGDDVDRRLAWFLVVGTIPAGVVGLLAEHKIEELFHQSGSAEDATAFIGMAGILAVLGAALWLADRLATHERQIDQITLRDVLWIGLSQALAIFPGVSRSGSTITAGLALGLNRSAAARFSFLLSAPIIAGAGLKSLLGVLRQFQTGQFESGDISLFLAGFGASAVTGYVAIHFLLRFLQRYSTGVFACYRWLLAAVIVIVALSRA